MTLSYLYLFTVLWLVFFTFRAWNAIRGMGLLAAGDYAGARAYWAPKTNSWLKSTADAARYNIASCLHNEGRLEEAEVALRDLATRQPRGVLTGLTAGMLGATLLLLDKDHEEAARLIEQGHEVFPGRSNWIELAHLALSAGDAAGAEALVQKALAMPTSATLRLGVVSARTNPLLATALEGYLLGWYYERRGEKGLARAAYVKAAGVPRKTIYVLRAQDALGRLPPASPVVDESRPSLGPFAMQ